MACAAGNPSAGEPPRPPRVPLSGSVFRLTQPPTRTPNQRDMTGSSHIKHGNILANRAQVLDQHRYCTLTAATQRRAAAGPGLLSRVRPRSGARGASWATGAPLRVLLHLAVRAAHASEIVSLQYAAIVCTHTGLEV